MLQGQFYYTTQCFINIKLETMSILIALFTGDGADYEYEIEDSRGTPTGLDAKLMPTTYTVTQTVYATVPHFSIGGPSHDPSITDLPISGGAGGGVYPTPVVPGPQGATPSSYYDLETPINGNLAKGVELPEEEFLIRTVVLSNMTILHNR